MRIDKFVWHVRLAKTRSIASDLVQKGKIKLNQNQVKPSREVKIGDIVQVIKNTAVFEFQIKDLIDRRVGAKLVADYIIDCTRPEELEKYKSYMFAQSFYKEDGGKPNKHDRKAIDLFLDNINWDEA